MEANAWYHTQKCKFSASRTSDRTVSDFKNVGENLWVGWGEKKNMDPVTVVWQQNKRVHGDLEQLILIQIPFGEFMNFGNH